MFNIDKHKLEDAIADVRKSAPLAENTETIVRAAENWHKVLVSKSGGDVEK